MRRMRRAQSYLMAIYFFAIMGLMGLMYFAFIDATDIEQVHIGSKQERILGAYQRAESITDYATTAATYSLRKAIMSIDSSNDVESRALNYFTELMSAHPTEKLGRNYKIIKKAKGYEFVADRGITIRIESPGLYSHDKTGFWGSQGGEFSFWPVRRRSGNPQITSLFGGRDPPITGSSKNHPAIDIDGDGGDPVLSLGDGRVSVAGTSYLFLEFDNGWTCGYFHIQNILVSANDRVTLGQEVAQIKDSSSDHLDLRCFNHKQPLSKQEAITLFGQEHVANTLTNTPGVTTYATEYSIGNSNNMYIDPYCLFTPVIKEEMKQSAIKLHSSPNGFSISGFNYRTPGLSLDEQFDETCNEYERAGLFSGSGGITDSFVKELISNIISLEGGFVNDPDDPGKATNMGITIATLTEYTNRNGGNVIVTDDDVRLLTREEAEEIYQKWYFERYNVGALPVQLIPVYFDMTVNPGPAAAASILHDALSVFKPPPKVFPVVVDDEVASYAKEVIAENSLQDVLNSIADKRKAYYDQRIKADSRKEKFRSGWYKRADVFKDPDTYLRSFDNVVKTKAIGKYSFPLDITVPISQELSAISVQSQKLRNTISACRWDDYSCISSALSAAPSYLKGTTLCTDFATQLKRRIIECDNSITTGCECQLPTPTKQAVIGSGTITIDGSSQALSWGGIGDETGYEVVFLFDNEDLLYDEAVIDGTTLRLSDSSSGNFKLVSLSEGLYMRKQLAPDKQMIIFSNSKNSLLCPGSIEQAYCTGDIISWVDHKT